jgi:tRNA A-37 threonylcarbamoyl transferase component Bud32/tetratricopeptide (TPR) repeat protein
MERWQRIEELFHAAVALEGGERERFLERACGGDPNLLAEVRRLLEHDNASRDILAEAVSTAATAALRAQPRWIGPYRVLSEIGRGGMGAVYLAERDDEHYRQRVAIKLVRFGMDFAEVLERFRRERQFLANLRHPNIAQLLDGGSTEEGYPFLVMEYVDGPSILDFAAVQQLDLRRRVELFLPVCDAVAHAHRNLIVHRDIKPSNILVAQDGSPKLLDFGIARLLEPSEADAGSTLTLRWMTPEYASPEQLDGNPVTTATDVYSLAAVLHELLTGHRPVRAKGGEAPRMSGGSSRIPADLETIVMKGLREEPERRYSGVEALHADLNRFLANRPIEARQGAALYRLGKFAARHRLTAAAAVVVALSLGAGTAATLWQARKAAAAGARAEKRFNEVRSLARTFLFDFHDQVLALPNSTGVRERIVQRSLEYLDRLSRDAPEDIGLQRELATAYERTGDLLDSPDRPSLGKSPEARQSWEKAVQILEQLRRSGAAGPEDLAALSRNYCHLGRSLMLRDNRFDPALAAMNRCLEAALLLPRGPKAAETAALAAELRPRHLLMDLYQRKAMHKEALAEGERALNVSRRLMALDPAIHNRRAYARTLTRLTKLHAAAGNPEEMLKAGREAVRLNRAFAREEADVISRREYFVSLYYLVSWAAMMANQGHAMPVLDDEAVEQFELARQLWREDPKNDQAEVDFYSAALRSGGWFLKRNPALARTHLLTGREIVERRVNGPRARPGDRVSLVEIDGYLAALGRRP